VSLLYVAQQAKVEDNGDGTISVSSETSPSGVPRKWVEIAPFVWREEHGKDLLSARVENGRVVRFAYGDSAPFEVLLRTPWDKSGGWWVPAMSISVIALLLTVLAWPISALIRRHYGVAYALSGRDARVHRWVRIAALASALVLVCWVMLILRMLSNLDFIPQANGWIALLRILSPFAFIGGAAIGVWNAWVVLRSRRRFWAKLWAVLLAAALLVLLWGSLSFHLLSLPTGF
jgi:hypothetical protein